MNGPRALLRAIRQAGDPAFRRVVVQSAALSATCLAGLAASTAWLLRHAVGREGLVADAVAILGGAASLLVALWLFLPVAAVIATLFVEPICRAVERRWYPELPPAMGATLAAQAVDALALGSRLLVLSVAGLVAGLVVPGIGLLVATAINGWALGRGLFVSVAMRRMSRREALALYRANRRSVLPDGVALALASGVPVINLLVPVIGTASMVHLVERARPLARRLSEVA